MPSASLADRAVLRVAGEEARGFLQGLVTCDVEALTPGAGAYGALLSPQGKILVDFLLTEAADGGFLFDVPQALAADLLKRLTLYRLRAKIAISALTDVGVRADWGDAAAPADALASFADPRDAQMGIRSIVPSDALPASGDTGIYAALRIARGIPAGGLDFAYGDTFPHDANLDLLHGVDFTKGCYVGQEVVSRVQHRGSARKRVLRVRLEGGGAIAGTVVLAGDGAIGTLGSVAGAHGLALLRTDKAEEAISAGVPLTAGGATVVLEPAG